jgi:hypothetical protein
MGFAAADGDLKGHQRGFRPCRERARLMSARRSS